MIVGGGSCVVLCCFVTSLPLLLIVFDKVSKVPKFLGKSSVPFEVN